MIFLFHDHIVARVVGRGFFGENGNEVRCLSDAGYAGGIVSAGIDGERCADAVAQYFGISL